MSDPEIIEDQGTGCGKQVYGAFGANYEDGVCIDGWLWDLDSCQKCGQQSKTIVGSMLMSLLFSIPTFTTDILRFYPDYDVSAWFGLWRRQFCACLGVLPKHS